MIARFAPTALSVLLLLVLWVSPTLAGVEEIRLGLSLHDIGFLGNDKEEGMDAVAELLFRSPVLLAAIGSPRPHLGIAVNSVGDTSQLYAGLTWTFEPVNRLVLEVSLGGAIHDGQLNGDDLDRKQLGARVLFRETVAVGYRLDDRNRLLLVFDHESNARLARHNEGLNNIGLRWGYRF